LQTRHLALLTILSALCVGIQLAPRPPNVEFTSLLVFLIGAFFGVYSGSLLGGVVMFVNGFLSSWGFAGFMMPFQIAGMVLVGFGGGWYGKSKKAEYRSSSSVETAVLGALLTLIYDLITNFGVAAEHMLVGIPVFPAIVVALVSGAPFSLVHVLSNFFVFLAGFFPLTRVLQKFVGGENIWKKDFLRM